LQLQFDTFLNGLQEDQEELPIIFEKPQLLRLADEVSFQRASLMNRASTQHHNTSCVVILNRTNISNIFSARIPFDNRTLCSEIYKQAEQEFELPRTALHGLDLINVGMIWTRYDICIQIDKKFTPLDSGKSMSFYHVAGEVICELRLKPISLKIRIEQLNKELEQTFSSDMTCIELISQLVQQFKLPPSDDYGLLFFLDFKTNYWLDETHKLANYDLYLIVDIILALMLLNVPITKATLV
jgi:hypothetical protein